MTIKREIVDEPENRERAEQLERQVNDAWSEIDDGARAEVRLRQDGKFDLRLVSTRFEGLDSTQRESLFWSRIRRLPSSLTVRMTYALLLTPDESEQYFDADGED